MGKIFLIRPVRNVPPEVNERIIAYRSAMEAAGQGVHDPFRNTPQTGDPIGIRICRDNRAAMWTPDEGGMLPEVHMWFDPTSTGSIFDLGMAACRIKTKLCSPIVVANTDELFEAPHSFQRSLSLSLIGYFRDKVETDGNLLPEHWMYYGHHAAINYILENIRAHKETAFASFNPKDPIDLFGLGYMFAHMLESPHQVLIRGNTIMKTPEKSFQNVLLWLAEHTRDGPKTV